MTRDELSLLLYLESCAVDHSGRTDPRRMNDEDRDILARWTKDGYVESGRVCAADGGGGWVRLSGTAYLNAYAERRARADRLWESRNYETTAEKRKSNPAAPAATKGE